MPFQRYVDACGRGVAAVRCWPARSKNQAESVFFTTETLLADSLGEGKGQRALAFTQAAAICLWPAAGEVEEASGVSSCTTVTLPEAFLDEGEAAKAGGRYAASSGFTLDANALERCRGAGATERRPWVHGAGRAEPWTPPLECEAEAHGKRIAGHHGQPAGGRSAHVLRVWPVARLLVDAEAGVPTSSPPRTSSEPSPSSTWSLRGSRLAVDCAAFGTPAR